MNKFDKRVRELRLEKNLSRRELANILFVTERLISYWENGKRECDFDMLLRLADFFCCSVDFLLGKTDY